MPAYFAANMRLFENVHGLPEYRRLICNCAQAFRKQGQLAKSCKFGNKVVHGVAYLVDGLRFWTDQVSLRVESILFQKTMNGLSRAHEIAVTVPVTITGRKNSAVGIDVELFDDTRCG